MDSKDRSITDLFDSAGLTDAEVAKLSGVSRVTVSRIKNAKGGSSANIGSVRAVLTTYIDERKRSIQKKVGLTDQPEVSDHRKKPHLSPSDLTDLVNERALALLESVSMLRDSVYAAPGSFSSGALAEAEAAIDETYDKFLRVMGKI